MKTKTIIIFLVIIIPSLALAQEKKSYLDTLKISVDNTLFIEIATHNYKEMINSKANYDDIWKLQQDLKKIIPDLPVYDNYRIEYYPEKSLIVKEGERKKFFILTEKEVVPTYLNNELKIYGTNYMASVNFKEFDDLINPNLIDRLAKTFKKMPEKRRFARTLNYSIRDTTTNHLTDLDKKNGALDVLEIKIGIGAGIVKNQPLNNLTSTFGVILPKNGILKYNWYTSVRAFVTFDANNRLQNNTFINLGLRVNTSSVIGQQNWLGFEFGRIVKNEGNIFNKDTYVIGTIKEFGKFSVSTEIYFSDKFKKAYPGLRVEFDF